MPPSVATKPLRAIASLELAKGVLAMAAAIALCLTLGHDWKHSLDTTFGSFAQTIHFSTESISFLDRISRGQQLAAALALLAYSIIRFVEGAGLWNSKLWAKWLGALSGIIYIPFEIFELVKMPRISTFAILSVNLAIVAYLIYAVRREPARSMLA